MKKSYDLENAKKLVPLLESIAAEIRERLASVRELDAKATALFEDKLETTRYLNLLAELATHRRELRLAKKECEGLGCVLEQGQPTRIYIPGSNGRIDSGFRWEAGDSTIRHATPESTPS
ncbi:MAG: DUF2203 family protein [Planctomycetota bacterium]|nr:MAG: DUF2203 family protein [Planctomycetota bacterium]